MIPRGFFRSFFFLWIPILLFSGSEIPVKRRHSAQRLPDHAPVVDGKLDDACWQGPGWTGDFTQQQPNQGAEPSQETEFKILYDDRNLYVAIRAHDREPGKIERRISRRDDFSGDIVGICMDSYFDHRTGFEFNLTAAGVKVDLVPTGGGGTWDFNWNAVWEGKTAMEDSAWTAEYRIPFSQLRFPKKGEYVWGLHVWRWLHRYQEEDQFQMIPQDAVGTVHLFGELHGLKKIKPPRRIELLPYVLAKAGTFRRETGNPFRTGRDGSVYGGLDGKIGLSSNFNLDLTVYPDFGQVEADPSVINLTAFETFYEEKRPFFMEGRELLNFNLDDDILFYSRRIGHEPSYEPVTGDGAFVRMPESTDILAAGKLTGKTQGGLSIGILQSVTALERAEIETSGVRHRQGVEPLTHYFVGRAQKEWRRGQTILGGMVTSVNRSMDDAHLVFLNRAAYSGGMDFKQYWENKTYFLDIKALFSHVRGERQALLETQTASRHYFQRPDAGHLSLDSSLTSMSGHGGRIQAGRAGNSRIRFNGELAWWSPGLELNDIGYLRSADRIMQDWTVAYVVLNPGRFYLNWEVSSEYGNEWNFGKERMRSYAELFAGIRFKNFWNLHGMITREGSILDTRMLRGGPAFRLPDRWNYHADLTSDSRRRLVFDAGFFYGRSPDGSTASLETWCGADGRLSDRMVLSVAPSFSTNRNPFQYVATVNAGTAPRYVLGRIGQKTLGVTLRLNYYVTPDLSIQYYGQPFISAGRYSQFRAVGRSRAADQQERAPEIQNIERREENGGWIYRVDEQQDGAEDYRFADPDFNFREFRSNLVIRWEYRLGSTLYLVWSQGRTGVAPFGSFSVRDDMDSLFRIYPENVFLVKLNHWFNL